MSPETLKRIEAQADAEAGGLDGDQFPDSLAELRLIVRSFYLRGADAGYTAAKAEERRP